MIEHEDNLVNHRVTWFLVINGFLMTACGASLGTLATADIGRFRWAVFIFLTANCVLGILICCLAAPAILAANRHIGVMASWWSLKRVEAEKYGMIDFPPIIGEVKFGQHPFGEVWDLDNPYDDSIKAFWEHHQAREKARRRPKIGWGAERYPALFLVFWSIGLILVAGWGILVAGWGIWRFCHPTPVTPAKSITVKIEGQGISVEMTSPDFTSADALLGEIRNRTLFRNLTNYSAFVVAPTSSLPATTRLPASRGSNSEPASPAISGAPPRPE